MPGTAAYQPKRASPTALAIVILLHGAAIGALAMAKMDIVGNPFERTEIYEVPTPPPPPEVPPEPVKKVEPRHETVIDRVPAIVPTPSPPVYIDRTPVLTPPILHTPPAQQAIAPPPPPPPAKKTEPARARANLASYVSDADYPSSALRNEEQGTTRFQLVVGPDGRVKDCSIVASSGSSTLDSATCRIMKSRARFTPARNSDGQSVSDTVTAGIKWVLPDE